MVTWLRNLHPTNRGSIAGMENVYLFYKIPSDFGFESRWGAKEFLFSAPVHSRPGTHQAFPTTGTGSCW